MYPPLLRGGGAAAMRAAAALCCAAPAAGFGGLDWKRLGHTAPSRVTSPLPASYLRPADLPASYDLRAVNGTSHCGRVQTQQAPHVCGSCWANAATGALSDRFKLATGGAFDATLSAQTLLSFGGNSYQYNNLTGGSCAGGSPVVAYSFVHKYGIVDDTCAPYKGESFGDNFGFEASPDVEAVRAKMCHYCDFSGNCVWLRTSSVSAPRGYDNAIAGSHGIARRYSVDEYGFLTGEHAMMAEIYARGPIACSIKSAVPQFDNYTGGVIAGGPVDTIDHVVVIAGWGVTDEGAAFWVGRNSFGTRWGEGAAGGWFRLQRGNDALGVESYGCAWAVPAAADVAAISAAAR